jgi:lipoate-protein ligase A
MKVKKLYTEEDLREAFREGFDAHYETRENYTIQEKEDNFISNKINETNK